MKKSIVLATEIVAVYSVRVTVADIIGAGILGEVVVTALVYRHKKKEGQGKSSEI